MRTVKSWTIALALVAGLAAAACGPVEGEPGVCNGSFTCSSHGSCDDSSGSIVCTCAIGYAGDRCELCDTGYEDNGSGVCLATDPCVAHCANQNRECVGIQGDIICGDCLEGYYEEGGLCYEACATESNPGEIVPLDLYIMLDRSSSMNDSGKWGAVTSAIQTFVQAPDVAGIGVGIQYFPVDPSITIPTSCTSAADCGLYGPCLMNMCGGSFATDTSCDPADYSNAEVPIAELPGVQQSILNSLNGQGPQGSATPTEPAMGGAVTYATAWAQAHPTHLTFIVFATDGEPTGCSTNSISGTSALAQSAANANPSVKTFVIGVGDGLDALNQIATAGGTGQAFLVDTGGNVTQQFIDALNEIRLTGGCMYQIPMPQQGTPDFGLINVRLVDPADPASAVTIPNVTNAAGCDPLLGGWYYDDPAAPSIIMLCPASCDEVAANNLEVEILVGCTTIVN
ncbi:MAG: hypothetical protein ABI333_14150 [bacterium]